MHATNCLKNFDKRSRCSCVYRIELRQKILSLSASFSASFRVPCVLKTKFCEGEHKKTCRFSCKSAETATMVIKTSRGQTNLSFGLLSFKHCLNTCLVFPPKIKAILFQARSPLQPTLKVRKKSIHVASLWFVNKIANSLKEPKSHLVFRNCFGKIREFYESFQPLEKLKNYGVKNCPLFQITKWQVALLTKPTWTSSSSEAVLSDSSSCFPSCESNALLKNKPQQRTKCSKRSSK